MRLTELDPRFVRYETRIETYRVVEGDPTTWLERGCPTREVTGPKEWKIPVETFGEAQGIEFLCPKCYAENAWRLTPEQRADPEAAGVGIHKCRVTFEGRGVSPEQGCHNDKGEPTRWEVSGDSFENLTTKPSIQIQGGCNWHGFITAGAIE